MGLVASLTNSHRIRELVLFSLSPYLWGRDKGLESESVMPHKKKKEPKHRGSESFQVNIWRGMEGPGTALGYIPCPGYSSICQLSFVSFMSGSGDQRCSPWFLPVARLIEVSRDS